MTSPAHVRALRRWIAVSATLTVCGLGLSVIGWAGLGGVATVGSTIALVWTMHRFGRTGPDESS